MLASYQFEYDASLEVQGYEFTACCPSSNKKAHCLFGTSNGRLFYVRQSKEFAVLEILYKREVPIYG